jgi:6-phosphofructokinase
MVKLMTSGGKAPGLNMLVWESSSACAGHKL